MPISSRLSFPEHITKASNRVDQFQGVPVVHFFTKEPKECVKCVVFNFAFESPNGLDNGVPRQDPSGMPHQEFEQHILGFGYMKFVPTTLLLLRYRIKFEGG